MSVKFGPFQGFRDRSQLSDSSERSSEKRTSPLIQKTARKRGGVLNVYSSDSGCARKSKQLKVKVKGLTRIRASVFLKDSCSRRRCGQTSTQLSLSPTKQARKSPSRSKSKLDVELQYLRLQNQRLFRLRRGKFN